jgi:hypothetical protein
MKRKSGVLEIAVVIPCRTASDAEKISAAIWKATPDVCLVLGEFSAKDYNEACIKAGENDSENRNRHKTWGYEELETPLTKTKTKTKTPH